MYDDWLITSGMRRSDIFEIIKYDVIDPLFMVKTGEKGIFVSCEIKSLWQDAELAYRIQEISHKNTTNCL